MPRLHLRGGKARAPTILPESLSGNQRRFSFQLNGLDLLAVFLRIARNLALREAIDPLIVRNRAPFAARANPSTVQQVRWPFFSRLLGPSAAGVDMKDSDIAARQQLQW